MVQFGWEVGLLIGGIRSAGFSFTEKMSTMLVNSLLETNLGMPYVYFIFLAITSKVTEQFKPRENPLTWKERLKENNRETVK